MRCETLAASRDHFRRKVEELCQRILHQQVPEAVREEVIPASELQLPAPAPVLQAVEGNSSAHPQSKPSPDFSLEWLQQQKSELLATGLYTDVSWQYYSVRHSLPRKKPLTFSNSACGQRAVVRYNSELSASLRG